MHYAPRVNISFLIPLSGRDADKRAHPRFYRRKQYPTVGE